MISLKRSMDVLGETQARLRSCLNVYKRALSALDRAAEVLAGEDGRPFRERLKSASIGIEQEAPAHAIEQSGQHVAQELDLFVRELAKLRDRREKEYKQIIRIVAEAGVTMAKGGSSQSEELAAFAARLDTVTRLESVAEIRHQLASRVTELQEMASRIQVEGQARAQALEKEIRNVQDRLKAAEALAETDVLTGLGNRRMAENAMRAAIGSGMPFSLLVFDLDSFKSVNDRFGHSQGDRLLKAVGEQLKRSVRESDVVCRWGGDEFVVLLADTSLVNAEERAAHIRANAFGRFVLGDAGKTVWVEIDGSAGIAEYQPGETPSEFFARADQVLYEKKPQRQLVFASS